MPHITLLNSHPKWTSTETVTGSGRGQCLQHPALEYLEEAAAAPVLGLRIHHFAQHQHFRYPQFKMPEKLLESLLLPVVIHRPTVPPARGWQKHIPSQSALTKP